MKVRTQNLEPEQDETTAQKAKVGRPKVRQPTELELAKIQLARTVIV